MGPCPWRAKLTAEKGWPCLVKPAHGLSRERERKARALAARSTSGELNGDFHKPADIFEIPSRNFHELNVSHT